MVWELHPIVARLLAARGFSGAALEEFLDPSARRLLPSNALPGMADAVRVIFPFLVQRRPVVVFGDYDADGVCATAILVEAMRRLGGRADAFIPDRFAEGYGMTAASLGRLMREFPDVALVVTVDNGINAVDEVRALRERGVAVVVTDHHLPAANLPVADALVNPKVASVPGMENLCGAGVAFFLAGALAKAASEAGIDFGGKFSAPLLVLAGLATVTDIVPLTGQNRILVAQSLAQFSSAAPMGLKELMGRAARRAEDASARDYGFALGPRINAAGRIASAMDAYKLIVSRDREEVRSLAQKVDSQNGSRKTFESRMFDEAMAQVTSPYPSAVVVSGDGWHSGVSGIVAARLMEAIGVPVAVVVDGRGSARAPDGYNVRDALAVCSGCLDRFGGHAAAGGFSVRDGSMSEFVSAFQSACAAQAAAIDRPAADSVSGEMELEPSDITLDLCRALRVLEPVGEGNPAPKFVLRNVHLKNVRTLGADGKHMEAVFANRLIPRAVWWGHGKDVEMLRARAARAHDIAFYLTTSTWSGEEVPELCLSAVS